jgi:hypothetical protein
MCVDDYSTIGAGVLDEIFRLDPQLTPAGGLPGGNDSDDCTNDGCTGSCVGCDDGLARRPPGRVP